MPATYAATSSAGSGRSGEPVPDRAGLAHAVDAEGAPVVALDVEGDEVPAGAHRHEPVGLDAALGSDAVVGAVGEAQDLAVAGGRGDQGQRRRSVCGPRVRYGDAHRVGLQRVDPAAEPLRQHLLQLGQRPQGRLLHARDRPPRCAGSTAIATASSSSSSSGGIAVPADSR